MSPARPNTRTASRETTPWPSREALIEWGMQPCGTGGCRVLVNADEIRYCLACQRRRSKKGRNKKLHPRGK